MARKYVTGFMFHLLLVMFHMKIEMVEKNQNITTHVRIWKISKFFNF
jgi:hypothetical protein